jgi:hypothetical protein
MKTRKCTCSNRILDKHTNEELVEMYKNFTPLEHQIESEEYITGTNEIAKKVI